MALSLPELTGKLLHDAGYGSMAGKRGGNLGSSPGYPLGRAARSGGSMAPMAGIQALGILRFSPWRWGAVLSGGSIGDFAPAPALWEAPRRYPARCHGSMMETSGPGNLGSCQNSPGRCPPAPCSWKLPDFALGDFRRLHDGAVTSGKLPRGVRGIGKLLHETNNRFPPLFSHRLKIKHFFRLFCPISAKYRRINNVTYLFKNN